MIISELISKLGFEIDERPLQRVEHLLEGVKSRLEFLAAAEITKRLYEVSERFADWGRNLSITAGTIGVTTDELQKLSFAAERNGASTEEMNHALAHLARHLYEAQNGSKEAANTFTRAGFTPDQVRGFRTAEDALFALSDRLHAMPSPIARVATAQELLGRGGYRMAYFLGQGSAAIRAQGDEARRLGLVLSSGQVGVLERLAFTFQKFESLLRSVGAQIAAYFAPNLDDAVNTLIRFYETNKEVIGLNVRNWLDSFAYGLGYVTGGVLFLLQVLINLDKKFDPNGNLLKIGLRIAGSVGGLLFFIKTLSVVGSALSTLLAPVGWVARAFLTLAGGEGIGAILVTGAAAAVVLSSIALGVQSIWAAANGRQSWLSGIAESLNQFVETGLGPFTSRLTKWGETLGSKVSEALLSADWGKVADQILVALGGIFVIAYKIGESIATSIADGISKTFREKFPKLSEFLFPAAPGTKEGEANQKEIEKIYKAHPELKEAPAGTESSVGELLKGAVMKAMGFGEKAGAALSPSPIFRSTAQLSPVSNNTFDLELNVNVATPTGDPQAVAAVVVDKIRDHWGQMMREASRSLGTQVVV